MKTIRSLFKFLLIANILLTLYFLLVVFSFNDCTYVNSYIPAVDRLRGYGMCVGHNTIWHPEIVVIVNVVLYAVAIYKLMHPPNQGRATQELLLFGLCLLVLTACALVFWFAGRTIWI